MSAAKHTPAVEVRRFMADQNQARAVGFDAGPGISVLVRPMHASDNERAVEVAKRLAGDVATIGQVDGALLSAQARVAELESEVRCLRAQIPPKAPARLFGPGFVRFDGGQMWLLGNREKGWGAFGFLVDGWDDLFRRYDVRVVAHGAGKIGPWWQVESIAKATGGAA